MQPSGGAGGSYLPLRGGLGVATPNYNVGFSQPRSAATPVRDLFYLSALASDGALATPVGTYLFVREASHFLSLVWQLTRKLPLPNLKHETKP